MLYLLLSLITAINSNAQETEKKDKQRKWANTFLVNQQNYQLDIEAAGIANIKNANITSENELWIDYAYTSGAEKRKGRMKMLLTDQGRFEGDWKTNAHNGNNYNGSLYLVFKESGEASGQYQYSGTNYKIAILKRK